MNSNNSTIDYALNTTDVLKMYGGIANNNLLHLNLIDNQNNSLSNNSLYYDIAGMESFLAAHVNEFCLLSLNIQCLHSKFDEFQTILTNLKHKSLYFDCIMIQETWMSKDSNYNLYHIDGYKLLKKDLEDDCSKHGGLITYIRDNYPISKTELISNRITYEGLLIKIKTDIGKILTLLNIYRPPSNVVRKYDDFINDFIPLISSLSTNNGDVIISGDFNVDLLKRSNVTDGASFLDHMTNLNFSPKLYVPTRFAQKSCSLIDNIYLKNSPNSKSISSGVVLSNLSDHCPYFISLNVQKTIKDKNPQFKSFRYHSKQSETNFKNELNSIDFEFELDYNTQIDPIKNYEKFINIISNLINKHFPLKNVKFRKYKHKLNDWITYGIIKSIKVRDKLYKKVHGSSRNSITYDIYSNRLKTFNTILKRVIKTAKTLFYESEFAKNKNDVRKTWDTIKHVLNNSPKNNTIPNFLTSENSCHVTDKGVMANKFNDFFVNIGKDLASKLSTNTNTSYKDYMFENVNNLKFTFHEITETVVKNIILELKSKNSCGMDGITSKVIKTYCNVLCKPITIMINQSLNSGIFPDQLKIAKVLPIYKGNNSDSNKLSNYRPISILPVISKIFERVIYNQLYAYFIQNNLFYSSQYGFRSKHSTELAALEFVDRINNLLDSRNTPLAIFMDLSKAFDTINHTILIHKLHSYGISDKELRWFESYLQNRKQFVSLNDFSSPCLQISTGVPQGSILGPLLFLIYVNDLSRSCNLKLLMYADDTSLVIPFSVSNLNFDISLINGQLNSLYDWLVVNKLSLNTSKTKFMLFHLPHIKLNNSDLPDVKINGQSIEKVEHFKFLGIYLDSSLSWDKHVFEVGNKISKTIGTLAVLKHYFPVRILLMIYNSLILSHLNYGITLWGFNNCTRLKQLQKRAIRYVNKSSFFTHSKPLCYKVNCLLIDDIFDLACLKFYFKFKNGLLPNYFYVTKFVESYETRRNLTRISYRPLELTTFITNAVNFRPCLSTPSFKFISCQKCLRFRIPFLLNNKVPSCVADKVYSTSLLGFSNYYKKFCLNSYNINCSIVNCFVCSLA